ncbi:MAG: response regulator transcription factor [Lachnospiraceae bacterium]
MKILIVEDEPLLSESISALLKSHDYETESAYDGEMGLEYALLGIYDLIILDIMLPRKNGYEVAKQLRSEKNGTPILMLTARTSIDDRIEGLDCGADYYLGKPFNNRELLACINALLRRQGVQINTLTYGNTTLELSSAVLSCCDEHIRLSAKEFEIMRLLMNSGSNNLPKEHILSKVWGYDSDAVENNVEVYIGFLRKKLAYIGSNIKIEAIRRLGYHLTLTA